MTSHGMIMCRKTVRVRSGFLLLKAASCLKWPHEILHLCLIFSSKKIKPVSSWALECKQNQSQKHIISKAVGSGKDCCITGLMCYILYSRTDSQVWKYMGTASFSSSTHAHRSRLVKFCEHMLWIRWFKQLYLIHKSHCTQVYRINPRV